MGRCGDLPTDIRTFTRQLYPRMDKTQLAIEITEDSMSAFELNGSTTTLLSTINCTVKTDSGYKQTLQDVLAACGNLDRFSTYSCSWSHPQSTLVPMLLFASSTPQDILNFTCHTEIPKDEIDYNRIPEWSIVNVYRIPMWIKSALIIKIPRVVIQHEMTHVLRQLNTGSTIPQRSVLILQENHFSLVVRKNGQIAHASYQVYQTPEDVLYHVLYTYKQLELQSKGELFVHSRHDKSFETAEKLQQLASGIKELSEITFTVHRYDHLQFQTLCV